MQQENKLYCEKSYLERVAETYKEGSMLNRFYLFLAKKKKEVKKNNGKEKNRE